MSWGAEIGWTRMNGRRAAGSMRHTKRWGATTRVAPTWGRRSLCARTAPRVASGGRKGDDGIGGPDHGANPVDVGIGEAEGGDAVGHEDDVVAAKA